jgi:hypothetical protein
VLDGHRFAYGSARGQRALFVADAEVLRSWLSQEWQQGIRTKWSDAARESAVRCCA